MHDLIPSLRLFSLWYYGRCYGAHRCIAGEVGHRDHTCSRLPQSIEQCRSSQAKQNVGLQELSRLVAELEPLKTEKETQAQEVVIMVEGVWASSFTAWEQDSSVVLKFIAPNLCLGNAWIR